MRSIARTHKLSSSQWAYSCGSGAVPCGDAGPRDPHAEGFGLGTPGFRWRFQSRVLLALRHQTFFSMDAMNAAIRRELDRLNHAPMACGETRRAVFETNERAVLQPLPVNPWEWGEWIGRKVAPNGHMRIERNLCLPFISSGVHQERRPVRRHW